MTVAVLIVAAGRGSRASRVPGSQQRENRTTAPKQYYPIGGVPVLARAIAAFRDHADIGHIQIVIHPDDAQLYGEAIRPIAALGTTLILPVVYGGATRQESVRLGLQALRSSAPRFVLIHDAARPFVSAEIIDRVLTLLRSDDRCTGAIAALPLSDSLKRSATGGASAPTIAPTIAATVDRAGLWRAQTPQGFAFAAILSAHEAARVAGESQYTDDASIAEWAGLKVALVAGSERNIKLTTAEDLSMAEHMITAGALQTRSPTEVRTGSGFDVHSFAQGDGVWLCGVKIPHTHRLEGHSDADVALHALTDAILGAIGDGDIGIHFPPSDQRWKGAASHLFLRHAAKLVADRAGRITNVDITILAEAPKISPHRTVLCRSVADILGIAVSRVSVKATTTEGLGFTGRREGIAAMATATVTLPTDDALS